MAEPEKQQDLTVKETGGAVVSPGNESGGDSTDFEQKPIGPPATRREVWAYYAYYAGNNGIGSYQ
jgi:hypothetical protein